MLDVTQPHGFHIFEAISNGGFGGVLVYGLLQEYLICLYYGGFRPMCICSLARFSENISGLWGNSVVVEGAVRQWCR